MTAKLEFMTHPNGHLADKIQLEQRVPQGYIIFPFIFIIAVEILLIKITKSKNIKGVTMDGKESKAQTFADDTTLTTAREEESFINCIKYIEEFKKISGLAANLDKKTQSPLESISVHATKYVMIWRSIGLKISNF